MNFDDAIKAHSSWKGKIAAYLERPDQSIDATSLELDNQCALGKWIHGDGKVAFGADATFKNLKLEHAKFHREAAALVKRANGGEKVAAEATLGGDSAYSKQSARVVGLIVDMKRKAVVAPVR